jgi:ABC-type Fe3+-hydroxamate transport system substrate-binding protein
MTSPRLAQAALLAALAALAAACSPPDSTKAEVAGEAPCAASGGSLATDALGRSLCAPLNDPQPVAITVDARGEVNAAVGGRPVDPDDLLRSIEVPETQRERE